MDERLENYIKTKISVTHAVSSMLSYYHLQRNISCCELQIINILGIKKGQHMSTISIVIFHNLLHHTIKGLHVGNVGISLKYRTNLGFFLNVGNVGQLGGLV